MACRHFIPFGLVIATSIVLSGCVSRKLAVMDLHDTLDAIADELCIPPVKEPAKVTLVTATGMTVGVDAASLGIPISVSGNVSDSTTIEVQVAPQCASDESVRAARRAARAVYSYDTATGTLTPLNEAATDRERKAKGQIKKK